MSGRGKRQPQYAKQVAEAAGVAPPASRKKKLSKKQQEKLRKDQAAITLRNFIRGAALNRVINRRIAAKKASGAGKKARKSKKPKARSSCDTWQYDTPTQLARLLDVNTSMPGCRGGNYVVSKVWRRVR